jgi:hypothetical protein
MQIQLEDRTTLGSALGQILATLPPETWSSSIMSFTLPTIECMESLAQVLNRDCSNSYDQYISRMDDEICILTNILRSFHYAASKLVDEAKVMPPILSLLHRIWPTVKHIAKALHDHGSIVSSLSDFLKVVVSFNHDVNDILILKEACDVVNTIIKDAIDKDYKADVVSPILNFVEDMVDNFGHLAEKDLISSSLLDGSAGNELCQIIQELVKNSYDVFYMKENRFRSIDDTVPGIFSVLRVSVKRCPYLFFGLRRSTGEEIFTSSLNAAELFMDSKQTDVLREAILFLCDTVCIPLYFISVDLLCRAQLVFHLCEGCHRFNF